MSAVDVIDAGGCAPPVVASASPVNVLAVMDDDRTAVERMIDISETDAGIESCDAHLYRHDAARAAVAELIAEAQRVVDGATGDMHYLRAALARCGGGK